MEPSQSIGHRIRVVRGELSQKAFGLRIGLSQTAVTALENGQSEPRLGTFNSIVEAFGVSPEWLRTGSNEIKGRALTPAPPTTAPTPGLTSGAATVAEAENVLLRELLTSKNTVIELLRSEVTELRGKSPDSSDAAGPLATYPPKPHVPVTGFQLAVQRRARGAAQTSR